MTKPDEPEGEQLKDLNNRITEYERRDVLLNTDLREQDKLIAALRVAEAHSAMLAAIVNSSNDAIISKNFDSIITSWNNAAERIFGYTAEEMIGQSILKLIPADRHQEEPEIINKLKRGERVEHFETKRLTKQGTLIDVSLTISPVLDASGRITGVSKIARDITEKKLQERRKNDFIAIVSHELKTPLTSIRSYLQLALMATGNNTNISMKDLLHRAENQTRKMSSMIHDFLNLSRLEEGKMSLNLTAFSLNGLIDEVVSEGKVLAPAHVIEYKSDTDVEVYADREKLGHVLTNLLGNAIKYSAGGTTIEVACELKNDLAEVSIRDQGVGISPADQIRLFERFYRVQNDQDKNISGFGIGLYLAAEILKLHGSEINVQSEKGKGSTFSFTLPYTR